MPRLIETAPADAISLAELIARLDEAGDALADESALADFAPLLARLGRDRRFLGDLVIAELEARCRNQMTANRYSAQVIMLHRAAGRYFIRANFWPAENDAIVRASGTGPFFYGVPHDHNFGFLTVGYLGPGYWSDYYEYDYDRVTGFPGEKVNLRFVETSRLEEGKVLLYRAHRDVHRQLPADAMSVSINIVQSSDKLGWKDQYRFDVDRGEVAGLLNGTPTESLLCLAAHFPGGTELAGDFARRHPSDRIRFAAIRAMAGALPDRGAREAVIARAARTSNRFVRGSAAALLREMEAGRGWLADAAGK